MNGERNVPGGKEKTYNLGLGLLRAWMCFEIILCHFWNAKGSTALLRPFFATRYWAVPVFMLVAFLLSGKIFLDRDEGKIKKRLLRLCVPQVVWTVLSFLFFFIGSSVFGWQSKIANQDAKALAISFLGQLFFGKTFNGVMWFQVNIIVITALFSVVYLKFRRAAAFRLTVCLGLMAVAFQYTGINMMLFGDCGPMSRTTLGAVCEMLPLACVGLVLANYGILPRLTGRRAWALFSSVVCLGLVLLLERAGMLKSPPGFIYPGLFSILAACLTTAIFYLLPLENLPRWAAALIKNTSRYAMGVYFTHLFVGIFIDKSFAGRFFPDTEAGSFVKCIGIYVLCLILSFVISKVAGKWSKYLVE